MFLHCVSALRLGQFDVQTKSTVMHFFSFLFSFNANVSTASVQMSQITSLCVPLNHRTNLQQRFEQFEIAQINQSFFQIKYKKYFLSSFGTGFFVLVEYNSSQSSSQSREAS